MARDGTKVSARRKEEEKVAEKTIFEDRCDVVIVVVVDDDRQENCGQSMCACVPGNENNYGEIVSKYFHRSKAIALAVCVYSTTLFTPPHAFL